MCKLSPSLTYSIGDTQTHTHTADQAVWGLIFKLALSSFIDCCEQFIKLFLNPPTPTKLYLCLKKITILTIQAVVTVILKLD